MAENNFSIKFWGVRGSRPVPGPTTLDYGGNTPCVELNLADELIILDAGSGIAALGNKLFNDSKQERVKANIFFSHYHWDHIQGLPFFKPAWQKGNKLNLYGKDSECGLSLQQVLQKQMSPPFFPVPLSDMEAELNFHQIEAEEVINLGREIKVKTFANNHTNSALAFRIEYQNRSCCYLTDYEHLEQSKARLIDFIKESDILIYDTNFTASEYNGGSDRLNNKIGWGHSTWQKAVEYAQAASVKRLVLFHHADFRTDQDLAKIEAKAKDVWPTTIAAKEGMVLKL